jgi:general secretion pathway protein I
MRRAARAHGGSGRAAAARSAGFTLIEVLVALVIVAFGMGAVLTALTSAANNTMQLRERSFAEWVGLNQLSAARLDRAAPAGDKEGESEFAGTRWHWRQQASDMQIPGVKRIVIQVRHADEPAAGAQKAPDWLATVTGFRGDATASPQGTFSSWDSARAAGPLPGGGGTTPGGGATPVPPGAPPIVPPTPRPPP